jgi:DNA-binding MarR family transcriptional regulator
VTEPVWLTDQEQRSWRALTELIRTVMDQMERQLQRDAQMTLASYVVLSFLSEHEGDPPRMSDLALSLGWSQSRLSHAMTWLAKSGWVRRVPSPADKRSQLAQITALGRARLAEAAPGHVAAVRHLVIDALTEQQRLALEQISAAITARGGDPTS